MTRMRFKGVCTLIFAFWASGFVLSAGAAPGDITTVVGGGVGDGGPATGAGLLAPSGLFVDRFGALYIADTGNNRVRMVDSLGVIRTVAGGGAELGDGGAATGARLDSPEDVFVDRLGALYIADTGNNRVRMVDSLGVIRTVAGGGTELGDGGAATDANLNAPSGVFVDSSGALYIADTGNNRVRMVDSLGVIRTVAGGGAELGDGGAATDANLNAPSGVFVDNSGVIYIADRLNYRVRKVDASGVITTVAGSGVPSFSGDGGSATDARVNEPQGIFMDGPGNLYISSRISHRVRKVDASGMISSIAGKGRGYAGDGGAATDANLDSPSGLFVDGSGEIYISDTGNNCVRKVDASGDITTVVGSGPVGFYDGGFFGEGILATDASLNAPIGVFVGELGDIYVADTKNHRARRVNPSGVITTVAGNGEDGFFSDGVSATETSLNDLRSVFVDGSGNLYIADTDNHRVRRVDPSGVITTVAGNGNGGFSGDRKPATTARLNAPTGVFVDGSGNLYIVDAGNHRIRKVDARSGVITTVAGSGIGSFSGDGGPATSAWLNVPTGVFVDGSGNLHIADAGNSRIRKVDASGIITTVAGSGTLGFSGDGGLATEAGLFSPSGIFVDALGSLFIADAGNSRIRKVDASGIITTVAGSGTPGFSGDGGAATEANLGSPTGVFVDGEGYLYIVDTANSRIRRVPGIAAPTRLETGAPVEAVPPAEEASWPVNGARNIDPSIIQSDGMVILFNKVIDTTRVEITVQANGDTLAWQPAWSEDGTKLTLKPGEGDALSFDTEYSVTLSEVADDAGRTADEMVLVFNTKGTEAAEGNIASVAGNGEPGFAGDGGPATEMQLSSPSDVAVDSMGNLYVADTGNNRIRKVDAESGVVSTVAGSGERGFSGDGGSATDANLDGPSGVFVDSKGNVYIADEGNNRIRKVDAESGMVSTVAGSGERGFSGDGGSAADASLDGPSGVFVDSKGNVYIADRRNHRIRKVDAESGDIATVAGSGSPGFSGDGGSATEASLDGPTDVFADSKGNLYVVDRDNSRIRKVDAESGAINTVAGGAGPDAPTGDGGPATEARLLAEDVFVDSKGNLYISDSGRIRKVDAESGTISTVAGTGNLQGLLGDGGPATDASLSASGIFLDGEGDLYAADARNHRVRKVERVGAPASEPVESVLQRADFNKSGKVDFPDFVLFAQNFGRRGEDPGFDATYDLDNGNSVDFTDFVLFAQVFGKTVDSSKPAGR